jgi:hypothetical protein
MIFRSSNAEGFSHFPGDLVSGVHSSRGVMLSSNTISPVSDNTNEALVLRGKGDGGVMIGASTSIFGGMNRGTSTMTLVELPVSAIVYSTLTVPGLGVNDMLYIERPGSTLMSTALGMVGYSCTTANEAKIAFLNNLASTASIAADTPIKYAYIKST